MNVLFVVNQLGVGGVQRKVALLAVGLLAHGHQVDVATFFGRGPFAEPVERAGGRVISIGESHQYGHKSLSSRVRHASHRMLALRRLIRTGGYDIVYGLGPTAGAYASLATIRGSTNVAWGIESIPAAESRLPPYAPVLARRADLIIAASIDVHDACLALGFPPDRTVVIDNGVDFDRFAIRPDWRDQVRQSLGVGDREILLGHLGRVQPVKNLAVLIQAVAMVAENRPNVRVAIVGPADERYASEMKELAAQLGIDQRLTWIGPVHDAERYFNAFDIYISTSDLEGFQLTRVEAMACGTPCVLTDTADAKRIVGDFGRVVPLRDPSAVADAVQNIVKNEGVWTREAVRASVIDRFSAERQVQRTEDAFLRLLGGQM